MIGKTISHYKILAKLGEGGMGVVYKAEDTKLKRLVALKFLPSSILASEAEKTRFVHEAQAAAALNHPNICTIYEIDEVDGQAFIAMEFVEGESLKDKVNSNQLSISSVTDIAIQIAQGLAKAHEHGITHRDIKPANVMITKDGVAKILDFGLAKLAGQPRLTKTGSTLGTMTYMSPEQARGEEVDHRTDIWALGVVLYEMLTGQLPFKGEYEHAVMYSILNETPKPMAELRSGVPMALERIADKAMTKSPGKRYQHTDEMLADLRALKKESDSGNVKERPIIAKLRRRKRSFLYASLVGLLLLLMGVGLYLKQSLKQEAKINSIAVLPLANLSGDANQEYFADGMTEALISVLGQIQALRVISRTSVMQYKTAPKPLSAIARELNVDTVVEGSVEPIGNHVGITVRLIDAKTEKRLWSKSFERELREVIILQREIALAITREIEVRVTSQEQARLREAHVVDPEAYKLYLWGLEFVSREYPENYQHAVDHFEKAIKIDSGFAQAHTALVLPYYMLGVFGSMPKDETKFKAKQAAAKALELDNNLSEAHAAMATVRAFYDWDWSGAEEEYRYAIQLNPNNWEAHHKYGLVLSNIGRTREGVTEMMRALELNPLSHTVNGDLARVYVNCNDRQYDRAIEHCLKVLQLNPDYALVQYFLGHAYLFQKLYEKAIAVFETKAMAEFAHLDVPAFLGYAYALSGKREKALKLLEELQERLKKGEDASVFIAVIYVGLGEKGKALEMLELGSEQLQWFMVQSFLDPLRGEPRFQVLLKKMGLQK